MFKKGSKYTRKDIGELYFPGVGRPAGGDWDTGYVRVDNDLVVFMNIGIAGRTGHDFDNHFDQDNQTITWFGKPNTKTTQPTFQKLISGDLTPHFFARWDTKPEFLYLGVGKIISTEDGFPTKDGRGNPAETVKVVLTIRDAEDILLQNDQEESEDNVIDSFALEQNLEEFIVSNWDKTIFGPLYDIYDEEGTLVGQQYQTGLGPCDILARSKDKTEFLIIEMKKGRASDKVIGQLTRYMGAIKNKLSRNNEKVKGCIIAYEDDKNLRSSLSVLPDIDFYAYKISFSLEKIEVSH